MWQLSGPCKTGATGHDVASSFAKWSTITPRIPQAGGLGLGWVDSAGTPPRPRFIRTRELRALSRRHPDLPRRRPQPSRHVRSEAGRATGDPWRILSDRDVAAGRVSQRAPAPSGKSSAPDGRFAVRDAQRLLA